MSDDQCRDVNDSHYFMSLDTIFTSHRKLFYVAYWETLPRHTYPHHSEIVKIVYLQPGWTAAGDVSAHIAQDLPTTHFPTPLQARHVMTAASEQKPFMRKLHNYGAMCSNWRITQQQHAGEQHSSSYQPKPYSTIDTLESLLGNS